MMKRLILALALLALPATAAAQQLAPEPYAQEYLNYVTHSGVVGNNMSPLYYVGPYVGSFGVNGSRTVTSSQFSIYCVDVAHKAKSQLVNVTEIGSGATNAGMGLTRLGSGALAIYKAGAYLSSLFDEGAWQTVNGHKNTAYSIIHSAIWNVVQGADVGNATLLGWRDALLLNPTHQAAMASFNADGWYVLTSTDPTDPYSGQEFLIRTNVVPEPSTYVLLATGLLFLVAFGRTRFSVRGGGDLA